MKRGDKYGAQQKENMEKKLKNVQEKYTGIFEKLTQKKDKKEERLGNVVN